MLDRILKIAQNKPGDPAIVDDSGTVTYADLGALLERRSTKAKADGSGGKRLCLREASDRDYILDVLSGLCAERLVCPHSADMPEQCDTKVPNLDSALIARTSGSTGERKAVVVGVAALERAFVNQTSLPLGAEARLLQWSQPTWDAWGLEVLGPLLTGGSVVPHGKLLPDIPRLLGQIETFGVSALQCTANLFNLLSMEAPAALGCLKHIITAGEAVSPMHVTRFREKFPDVAILNGYGPAECYGLSTVAWLTAHEGQSSQSIGSCLNGLLAKTLLPDLSTPLPGGEGELYLAGDKLATGYEGNAAETAARFVADIAGDGTRMYRTGDVVRSHNDELEFVRRNDHLVKIDGRWVDLNAVERGALALSGVADIAAVRIATRKGSRLGLMATSSGTMSETAVDDQVRQLFSTVYPVVRVEDRLPLLSNGKRDLGAIRGAIVASVGEGSERARVSAPPVTVLMGQILGENLDPDVSFLKNGGNSLDAITLVHRLKSEVGLSVDVRTILRSETVAVLCAYIEDLV